MSHALSLSPSLSRSLSLSHSLHFISIHSAGTLGFCRCAMLHGPEVLQVHYLSIVCCLYIGEFTIIYPICITVFWRRAHQITVLWRRGAAHWCGNLRLITRLCYQLSFCYRYQAQSTTKWPYSYSHSHSYHHSSLLAFEAFNDFQVQLFIAEYWLIANGIIYGAYREGPQVGL